jgi:arylsulfatase A
VKYPGTYQVRILQGAGKGCGDASVDLTLGDQKVTFKTLETGHFQNFVPRALGTIKLEAGHHTLEVRPREKKGAAVMDLRRVTLVRVE